MSNFVLETSTENIDYDHQLELEAKRAIQYLQVYRNYRYVEFIAQGGYGWVSLMYDDDKKRQLAVKCVISTSEIELKWWPKLKHDSIVPLIEYVTLDCITVFIMPAMKKDLCMLVQEPHFYRDELSFGLCRKWLGNVAAALSYLHDLGLCHLDVQLDNILLKRNGYVCLGDFSLLTDITQVSVGMFNEVYLPPEYCEWCHAAKPVPYKDSYGGDKADLWQLGVLSIDLLTQMKVSRSCGQLPIWRHDVWPILEKILGHSEQFTCLLEESFEGVLFRESEFKLCYDFITDVLKLDPDMRTSAAEMAHHAFVEVGWPHVPSDFKMPGLITEHPSKPKPEEREHNLPSGPELDSEAVRIAEEAKSTAEAVKQKLEKIQEQKVQKRLEIAAEAGKIPVNVKHNLVATSKSSLMLDKLITDSQTDATSQPQQEIEVRGTSIIRKSVDVRRQSNLKNEHPGVTSALPRNTKLKVIVPSKATPSGDKLIDKKEAWEKPTLELSPPAGTLKEKKIHFHPDVEKLRREKEGSTKALVRKATGRRLNESQIENQRSERDEPKVEHPRTKRRKSTDKKGKVYWRI